MSRVKQKKQQHKDRPDAGATPSESRRSALRTQVIPAAVLVVAVVLAYVPAMDGDYIWDDPRYVSENPLLPAADGLQRIWVDIGATVQYYPLVFTTFWFEYRLWKLDTTGYHVVNILLHAISAVLLWFVLRRLRVPGAWLAAAFFALHPVQVESVAWITERKNVLAGFFYLAAALAYLHFEPVADVTGALRRRWRFYALASLLFLGALFSKTVTCSLPAAILLLVWWRCGRLRLRFVAPLVPWFAAGAVMARVTTWIEANNVRSVGRDWDLSLVDRVLVAGRALWFYVQKLLVPVKLTFNYPRWEIDAGNWWQYLFPVAALGLVLVLWARRERLGRAPLLAALFFGGTALPALGFTDVYPMRYSYVADHFVYLAVIGPLTLIAAWLAGRLAATPLRAVGAILVVLLAGLTANQARIYENRQTLWLDTLAKNPSSFLAHNNLGTIDLDYRAVDRAIGHFQAAVRLKPDFYEAQSNLGRALAAKGRLAEGEVHCSEAVRLKPDYADARYNLAIVLAKQQKFAAATAQYEEILRLRPNQAMAHNNLANVLAQQQRFAEAVVHYRAAVNLRPGYALAWRNLGLALSAGGEGDAAVDAYRQALRLQPGDPVSHANLAELLAQRGDRDGAIRELRAALRIDPNLAAARQALAVLEAEAAAAAGGD